MMEKLTNNRPAFETQYELHHRKVYRMVLGMTGNASDAEDIVQDAFLRAYKAYDGFREESSFFTWICRIAMNQASTHMKRRNRMVSQVLTENLGIDLTQIADPMPTADPETMLYLKEVHYKCLHSLTECLPDQQRKALCLCEILELPIRVAADILECSEGAVKTNLHKARHKRKQLMENWCSHLSAENPCRCGMWINFGKERGFLSGCEKAMNPQVDPDWIVEQNQTDIIKLRGLKAVYRTLYGEADSTALSNRIKAGIDNYEWNVLC